MCRKFILPALLVVALVVALGYLYAASQAPPSPRPVQNLTPENLADIRKAFNAAKAHVRMLLLLSPT